MRYDHTPSISFTAALIAVALDGLIAVTCIAGESINLEQVFDAWKNRQTVVRSARFEWIEHRVELRAARPAGLDQLGAAVPDEDAAYDVPSILKFDGSRMYYSVRDLGWHRGRFWPRKYITSFDGQTSIIFWPEGEFEFPNASIRPEKHNSDI